MSQVERVAFEPDDYDQPDDEPDEFEEAAFDCHGFFDSGPGRGAFVCMAVGSEDCDECPFNRDLGLTLKQIGERDGIDTL